MAEDPSNVFGVSYIEIGSFTKSFYYRDELVRAGNRTSGTWGQAVQITLSETIGTTLTLGTDFGVDVPLGPVAAATFSIDVGRSWSQNATATMTFPADGPVVPHDDERVELVVYAKQRTYYVQTSQTVHGITTVSDPVVLAKGIDSNFGLRHIVLHQEREWLDEDNGERQAFPHHMLDRPLSPLSGGPSVFNWPGKDDYDPTAL